MGKSKGSGGFSILELVVVIVVIGVLALVLKNPMQGYLRRLEFNKSVDNVKHLIQTSQSKAMANPNLHIGVWFADSSAGAFQDRANPSLYEYDAGGDPAYLQPARLKRGVRLVKLPGYPDEIVFRGDGSAYKSFRIAVTDGVLTDTLDVLASTGRVRVLK